MNLYGYRFDEVKLPEVPPIKVDVKFSEMRTFPLRRPVVQTSLGVHFPHIALPHPDPGCPRTLKLGVKKRFAMRPPEPDPQELKNFRKFVRKWIRNNLKPIPPTADDSVPTWLDKTNYPLWRRATLQKKYDAIIHPFLKGYKLVKSFMKMETYPEYKHARAINSRVDEFKCLTGPMFKLIEKEVFALDWFIKKIPIADRPAYIMNKIGHGKQFMATDHTAYEAHFTRELMLSCEGELYKYMTSLHPGGKNFMKHFKETICGRNHCVFKYFDVDINATRMSGEMNTSLGNGFSNLMFMLYFADKKGCRDVVGVVEGDDGLFTMVGDLPTIEDFKRLGLTLKLELHKELNTASFCGMVFDTHDLVNVTEPISEILNFGWTSGRYSVCKMRRKMELLRCKAMSMGYQYSGCPILTSLAKMGLRLTKDYIARPGTMSLWDAEQFAEAKMYFKGALRDPPIRTRLLVEELYRVPVEAQIRLEKYFDSIDDIGELDHEQIMHLVPHWSWKDYGSRYMSDLSEVPGGLRM